MSSSTTNDDLPEPDNRLTIAFLKCDTVPQAAREQHGTYEDILHNLFEPLLPKRLSLETKTYDAIKRDLPTEKELDDIDALVISGSFEDGAHTDETWILRLAGFLIQVHDRWPRIRIIGICFGLQVVARAFGPSKIVENEDGWEVGSTRVSLTPLGSELVWGETDRQGQDFIMTQQIHSGIVRDCPASFELLASSEITPVQGIALLYPTEEESGGKPPPGFNHSARHLLPEEPWRRVHIIAFQGHPEWHEDILVPLIDGYEEDGVYTSEFAEAARERARAPHDGEPLGRAILKVLGVGCE